MGGPSCGGYYRLSKARGLDQNLAEETGCRGVAASILRRESAWDLIGAVCARLRWGGCYYLGSSPGDSSDTAQPWLRVLSVKPGHCDQRSRA